jgi:hypothetical protein
VGVRARDDVSGSDDAVQVSPPSMPQIQSSSQAPGSRRGFSTTAPPPLSLPRQGLLYSRVRSNALPLIRSGEVS